MYRQGMAICAIDHQVDRIAAAQAADELLNVSGVQASFVLFPNVEQNQIILSARSMGQTNVQVIVEELGGGGNATVAGAQIPEQTLDQVAASLMEAIDKHCDDE